MLLVTASDGSVSRRQTSQMSTRHLICMRTCRIGFRTPLQALASSISTSSLLRSQSLSSPALRLTQVSHPHSLVTPHLLTLSFTPSRYTERSVRTQSRKCLPLTNQSQEKNMTSSILAAAAGDQQALYVSHSSTHVQTLTASRIASRLAPWREDCHHRGIRKARRYLRKRR